MLFVALQVLTFSIIVDENLGCCAPENCEVIGPGGAPGRSLGGRKVIFIKFKDLVNYLN